MSWKDAQEEASRWLDKLQLRNDDIRGKVLDLDALSAGFGHEGRFRAMVLEAAARILKKRGVESTFTDDSRG